MQLRLEKCLSAAKKVRYPPLHKSLNPGSGGRIRLRAKIHFSISPTLENFLEIQKFEKKLQNSLVKSEDYLRFSS